MSQMCPNCGRDNRDTGKFCAYCNTQLMGLLGMNTMLQKRYQIVGLLGCGGMGAVYLAQDQRLGPKKVAVKENFDTSQQAQQQFQFEAHILANLDHPNLPKVTDHFIEPSGRQYLVMEYVEGEDLESMRQRHPQGQLPRKQVLVWADALLDALTYLHTQPNPVIHRDVKPANIKITPQGKVRLVDFGIAKIYRPGQVTHTGARAAGSPGFAPVEQYIGGTDARSDIYSLGATLYCLLTGQLPPESAARAAGQPLPPPRQIRPEISDRTQQVIFRAMAVSADQRFQTANEMRQALKGMAPPPIQQPAVARPAKKTRPWLLLGCGALVVGIALCVAGYLAMQTLLPTPTPSLPTPLAATATSPVAVVLATEMPASPTPTAVSAAVTATPLPPPAEVSPTEAAVDTPVPATDTPVSTDTPVPAAATPLPVMTTLSGAILVLGEPWENEGVSLAATSIAIRAESDWADAAAQVWFRFFNKTGQKLLVEIDWGRIHLEDSLGNRYVDWEGGGTTSAWVEPGRSLDFDRYYTRQPKERSRVPSSATFVQVVVEQFSRISGARWQADINPILVPMAAPDPGTVKGMSETWEQGGLALTLKKVEIRAEGDYADAAAQAWFALTNRTNERLLVEVDLAHIYLVDSFGRRFNDWDGGGLMTQWVDPGESWEFDRYYSEMAEQRSRITRGTQFVLVMAENISRVEKAQWKVDIVSVLSSMSSPSPGTIQVLGEPWESEGVSLAATSMAIRAESDWADAAAQVWFRFFNKTGQRLLVEIDWSRIHLEDSLGNRYVDWDGGGSTSVWVEPGNSYNFDRYYSRQPKERSRMPSNAAFVQVVVDQLSRIAGARWQADINPPLTPVAAPDPWTVKGISEAWEQGGLALTLKKVEIRAEGDYADAAAQAWFALTNRTNERLLVEVDLAYIYLVDSFGRRFNDWDGGGLMTRWVEPGQSWEFDRYYSEMAKQRSRITRSAEFVLVKVEKLGWLEGVQWQFDIVR